MSLRHCPRKAALTAAAASIVLAACGRGAVAGGSAGTTAAAPGSYDIVISNGHVVDGTGNAWFAGDVGIRGDRIATIAPAGALARAQATTRIDAAGKVVAPGFIDIQGQSVFQFTVGDGRVVGKVSQGITTEILGEGTTPAPLNAAMVALLESQRGSRDDSLAATAYGTFTGPHGFGRWLDAMEQHGTSVNVGSFLGAATVRVYAKGYTRGDPSPAELDTMRAVTRNAMQDGAFGIASALIYPPGNFATTGELVEMAKAMAPLGGVYITHMRSEADGYLEAIDEVLRIGREGGVPTEIYHLKAGGVRNWPKAAQAVAKIDSARAAGQDIAADMYPYTAGGTSLSACTPPWATEGDKLLDRLRDPATRAKIIAEMQAPRNSWENLCALATPAGIVTAGFEHPDWKQYEGKRLAEIAADRRTDWANTIVDVLLGTEGRVGMLVFMMSEPNVEMQMRQPWMKFGTDADGLDPDSAKGLAHPRSYGTFPRILGHYVRERRVMTLEEAVRKMTSAVANRLSIRDRGQLREGFLADVVVFDPATIIDNATYTDPHRLSTGVSTVIVNGVRVWSDGKHTGAKPGRVVRGPGHIAAVAR
ncbi:MAG: D-aminoacylase [Gemmatimonadaceae bacterium]|nr:D-aminoacylase [Gemmatimonadaceae bacterium]